MSAGGALLAIGGLQAFASMQSAKAQAKGLAAQASMARLQGRQEALKYKQQGVAVLDNILRTQSAINARKAAGNVDPFSGSGLSLMRFAQATGTKEYAMTENNALIALRGGEMQAGQYMTQATATMRAGMLQGISAIGQAYATKSLIGTAPLEPTIT
jgi:hypothetical protein